MGPSSALTWDPHPLGLPKVLTVAHMVKLDSFQDSKTVIKITLEPSYLVIEELG